MNIFVALYFKTSSPTLLRLSEGETSTSPANKHKIVATFMKNILCYD